ncbi:DNA cytosine methyltransferase [Rhizobium pusense]|nr:DNA (cytosine-5-)-methyltransferase [Agrobacterium pusense]MDH2092625.1 DNA cytosine methyltransferase [Agrobacterium pusense]
MRYLSLFSGIEAATIAWKPLGWTPYAFAEIEKFPSAVLAHHYGSNMPGEPLSCNGVPNFGDVTKFKEWPDGPVDLICGGSPCQSFSVAGLRKGMDDPRGNLALVYLAIVNKYRPRWVVYENVPGLLSSNGGRDFGSFVGGLAELGYGFAYRVLDAQYVRVDGFGRAVPQRRRRVFVVGYLGDWRRAAAVLLEPQGMRGDSAPRREPGKRVAPTIASRPTGGGGLGTDFDLDGGLITSTGNVAHCLNAGGMGRQDYETETMVAHTLLGKENSSHGADLETYVAHTLKGEGFDASEDGTGRGTPIVPIAFNPKMGGDPTMGAGVIDDGTSYTLDAAGNSTAVAFDMRGREGGAQFEGPHETANIRAASGGSSKSYVAQEWAVRRLTPTECERLQGFPDNFTNVPWGKKDTSPDGPRYKALGNSFAVNVVRWIGQRIQKVEDICKELDRENME